MKRQIQMAVLLPALLALAVGCSTTLEQGGAYKGDEILYNADKTITSSYRILHSFVKWEYENRAALPVGVSQVADSVRENAETWMDTAINLREAYAANPNRTNQTALEDVLDVLQVVLTEATRYMVENQKLE